MPARPSDGPRFSCSGAASERRAPRARVVVTVACLTEGCGERLRFARPAADGVLRATCAACGRSYALGGGRVGDASPPTAGEAGASEAT